MENEQQKKYPHNAIAAFETGAVLDLRMRLATQLLYTPAVGTVVKTVMENPGVVASRPAGGIGGSVGGTGSTESLTKTAAKAAAQFALDAASHLVELGLEAGYVTDLPTAFNPEMDAAVRAYAQLVGAVNVETQAGAAAYGKHMTAKGGPQVAVARPIDLGGGRRP